MLRPVRATPCFYGGSHFIKCYDLIPSHMRAVLINFKPFSSHISNYGLHLLQLVADAEKEGSKT